MQETFKVHMKNRNQYVWMKKTYSNKIKGSGDHNNARTSFLPHHSPKITDCVFRWTLSNNVGLGLNKTLKFKWKLLLSIQTVSMIYIFTVLRVYSIVFRLISIIQLILILSICQRRILFIRIDIVYMYFLFAK